MAHARDWNKVRIQNLMKKPKLHLEPKQTNQTKKRTGKRPCMGTTKQGEPCNGGAMAGTNYCGPHTDTKPAILKRQFRSKYPGTCVVCGVRWDPGVMIAPSEGKWAHAQCPTPVPKLVELPPEWACIAANPNVDEAMVIAAYEESEL